MCGIEPGDGTNDAPQLFATKAERILNEGSERTFLLGRHGCAVARRDSDDRGFDLGWRSKGARRHDADEVDMGERLHVDGKRAVGSVTGWRDHSLRDFALYQEDGALRTGGAKRMEEDGRRDVVRDVARDDVRPGDERGQRDIQHVGLHDLDVASAGVALTEDGNEVAIELHRHHATGTLDEQVRQRAPSGSDLDDRLRAVERERVGDSPERRRVGEEVLAESLPSMREAMRTSVTSRSHACLLSFERARERG